MFGANRNQSCVRDSLYFDQVTAGQALARSRVFARLSHCHYMADPDSLMYRLEVRRRTLNSQMHRKRCIWKREVRLKSVLV